MNKKIKSSQTGAISTFAMIAMIFFLAVVMGIYIISAKRAQTQSESIALTQDMYYEENEEVTTYDAKQASSSDTIPIYTKEQLWSIGESTKIEIDGVIYDFSQAASTKYVLQNDIIINISTDLANSKYKDNLVYSGTITTNGYSVYYYYNSKYYIPVKYNGTTITSGTAVLSASGTNFGTISTSTSGLSGNYYLFAAK